MPFNPIETDVVVLGAGPGGYAAAFYAADLGRKVTLVEEESRLGGVCLNRGCIPSKALLHVSKLMSEAREAKKWGIAFNEPKVDLDQLRKWKESVLDKLSKGIGDLAKMRNVTVMKGRGHFEDSHTLRVETSEGQKFLRYQKIIIAVGSSPALPKAFDLGNPRIMTSTEALELNEVPKRLLVVGGGYIGMELGTVYAALGSEITLIEALDRILAGADQDLARPVIKYAEKNFKQIHLKTKVLEMSTSGKKVKVVFENETGKHSELFDRVLVSVGRTPNTKDLGLKNTKVVLDEKGFIRVDDSMQTSDAPILAIGDVVGGALLAHKAAKEGRIAVETITGEPVLSHRFVVPAVVFTDPEVAWCGLTEEEARAKNIPVKVSRFTWMASGRAMSMDRTDGMTKLILEPETERILGVGVVGTAAGELISEGVLAIEMGATALDLAESLHPHPTLSETLMECAESFYGHATHTFSRKAK